MGLINIIREYHRQKRRLKFNRKELLNYQDNKFRNLLKHAWKNTNFYKDFYSSHGIKYNDLEEIKPEELPAINKEIVMDNFTEILVDKNFQQKEIEKFLNENKNPGLKYKDKYKILHTSGTSGNIGIYIYSDSEWDFIKANTLRTYPQGFPLKRQKTAYIGAVDGNYAGVNIFMASQTGIEKIFFKKPLLIDIKRPLKDQLAEIESAKPDLLSGYSQGLEELAGYKLSGQLDIKPDLLISGGEPLTSSQIQTIQKAWPESKLVDFYAASESPLLGIDKLDNQGMLLFEDLNIFEIEADGYFLTPLYKFMQPLIRYRMDDLLVEKSEEKNQDGYKRIDKLAGRDEETPVFASKSGDKISIHPIIFVEFYTPGLEKFKLIQTDKDSFDFYIRLNPGYDNQKTIDNIKAELNNILEAKRLSNVDYKIKDLDSLNNNQSRSSGKFKLIEKTKKAAKFSEN